MGFVIYNAVDPRDNQVFYVGATYDFRKRIAQHFTKFRSPVGLRIVSMIDCGVVPVFNILEQLETSDQANEREKYWSEFFTSMGMKLLPGSFVGYDRRQTAGRKFTYAESEVSYQQWLAGGPCPWKNESDYKRKFVVQRDPTILKHTLGRPRKSPLTSENAN